VQPAIDVIYVDNPKLFGVLTDIFPNAKLVQDNFHVMDRFSRAIPPDNTQKGQL